MFFARSFAKTLPERATAFVRVQVEQIMFQAEFAPAQQYPVPVNPIHMGYNNREYHPVSSVYTSDLQSLSFYV